MESGRRFSLEGRGKTYLFTLLTLAIIELVIEAVVGGFTSFPDTHEYVETVKWFEGEPAEVYPLRIQRPLEILMVLPLAPIVGIVPAFVIVNSLFYLGSIPFLYSFSRRLLENGTSQTPSPSRSYVNRRFLRGPFQSSWYSTFSLVFEDPSSAES